MQKVMLEGYGSYKGERAEALLVSVSGKQLVLRASCPLNPKETTDLPYRLIDGMRIGSSPERGFKIPSKVLLSIKSEGSNSSSNSTITERKGIQLKTKVVSKASGITLKPSNGKTKPVAKAPAAPVKRGPGRPRKEETVPVAKAPVQAAEAPRRRGRPPKAEAAPLPKGQARVMLSKGICDYVVSQIKPKTADENLRSLRAAITGGVHTNYVEVTLSKELAQTLLDFLAARYEKFSEMGVRGGAYKRGIPSLITRLQESFKGLKVSKTLGGNAPAASPAPVVKVKTETSPSGILKKRTTVEDAPVKRGPGRPPKAKAPEPVPVTPVKRGPGRPPKSVVTAVTVPVKKGISLKKK